MRRRVAAIEAHRNRLRRRNESLRSKTVAKRNAQSKLGAPSLLRKSVEAHWRPLDAPDRARAYAEQPPHVYRIACGRSRNFDEHTVTPAPSTRFPASPHGGSEPGRRTKAVLFTYSHRSRSAASHPFNRSLGQGVLGGSPNREHAKMNSNRSQIFSRFQCCISTYTKGLL